MKIIKIDYHDPDRDAIKSVARSIEAGKVAVVPGDAVYTIVGDAFNRDAVNRILAMKKRDQGKPFNLGLYSLDDIGCYGKSDPLIKEISATFSGEPFTFVVPRKDNVPLFLNPGYKTLGFRIPFNKVTSTLSEFHRLPVIGTSANISELKNTYSVEEFMDYFQALLGGEVKIDIVLDAGKLPPRRPSTVLEVREQDVRIIREGEISTAVLESEICRLRRKVRQPDRQAP